jgi:hypothetical protein
MFSFLMKLEFATYTNCDILVPLPNFIVNILSNMSGGINMTPAELQAMLAEAAAAVVAATHVQWNAHNPAPPVVTFKNFLDCKPHTFNGIDGAVRLLRWIEKVEPVFVMCRCPDTDRVKFTAGTLEGSALTWWNAKVQLLGLEPTNGMAWDAFKELLRREYTPRDQVQKL